MRPAAEGVADRIYGTICRKHRKPKVRKTVIRAIIKRLLGHLAWEDTRDAFLTYEDTRETFLFVDEAVKP